MRRLSRVQRRHRESYRIAIATKAEVSRVFQLAEIWAQKLGIHPKLAKALIRQESGGNPHAVSWAGARGPMQIMPATGKGLGLKTIADLHNPEKAVPAGLKLLKMNIQHCGSVAGGLSRYNSGSCKAYKNPKWAKGQTYHYVPAIVAMAKKGK